VFTYGGALTYNGLNLGVAPAGYVYTIDTGTVGQVNLIVSVPLDAFSQWQIAYFGSTNNPAAAPSADPDGDGISNTNEFLSGTNPTNSASGLRIISATRQATNVVVTWQTAGGKTNFVQATSGGSGGSYSTNGFVDIIGPIVIPGVGDAVTNQVDWNGATNNPSHYYRIRLAP
jgi:hypothetical protein